MDVATDSFGKTMTFQYKNQQEAGVWVLDNVTGTAGQTAAYQYSGGFLHSITYPQNITSTITYSPASGGLVEIDFQDLLAQQGTAKRRCFAPALRVLPAGKLSLQPLGMSALSRTAKAKWPTLASGRYKARSR